MIRTFPVRTISKVVSTAALTMAAFGFSDEELNGADVARMTAYSANIRYAEVGAPVVVSGGHLVEANKTVFVIGKEAINGMTVIAESGSPTLTVTLYKATEGAL